MHAFKRAHHEINCSIELGSEGFKITEGPKEGWSKAGSLKYFVLIHILIQEQN